MKVDEVIARVAHIREIAADDEAAHSEEDSLYTAVMQAIVDGAPDPIGLCREALKAGDIEFCRWYA